MSEVWNAKLAKTYMKMTEGYQGPLLIDWITDVVPAGSQVLELGMGPGKDLLELQKTYCAIGSDSAPYFLERYQANHPEAELILLDAVTLETDRKFDCICSNKVLQHLTRAELAASLMEQERLLKPDGILLHTFWKGSGEESHEGILFTLYSEEDLNQVFMARYEIVKIEAYKEEKSDDSIVVVVRKREK